MPVLFGNGELLEGRFFPQHQTSTSLSGTCGGNRMTPAFSCSQLRFPTSTPKPRAEGRVRASGTQVTSRPERSGDQVLLPLPQNRRKHCVSAGFLFTCVVWLWCSRWFRHRFFVSVCTCPQPSSSLPAPKTHPVLPFSGFPGCVFSFSALLDAQNFGTCFCTLCRIALQVEVVGNTS